MMDTIDFTEKDARDMRHVELRRYRPAIGRMTPGERRGLREWARAGNSVHDNPYCLYGENGWPLDYITAIRVAEDLWDDPENYAIAPETGPSDDFEDGGPPF
jgi:hypothetical protein